MHLKIQKRCDVHVSRFSKQDAILFRSVVATSVDQSIGSVMGVLGGLSGMSGNPSVFNFWLNKI